MKPFCYSILLSFVLGACSTSTVKEKIEQVGNVAGQTAGQFAKGVGNGVTKSFDAQVEVSENLQKKGIEIGKVLINSDTSGKDNLLSVYFIFATDFTNALTAKVFDSKSKEMGRVTTTVEGKKGEAKYIDFHFDKHTNIDSDCKLTIE